MLFYSYFKTLVGKEVRAGVAVLGAQVHQLAVAVQWGTMAWFRAPPDADRVRCGWWMDTDTRR